MFETPVGLLIREWDPLKNSYVDPGLVLKFTKSYGFFVEKFLHIYQNIKQNSQNVYQS